MMKEGLAEPDMEAAQQLVQLSGGEEEHGDSHKKKKEKKKKKKEQEEEGRAQISGRGKEEEVDEEEEEHRLRKRPRFRSLASIYKVSKPISNGHRGSRKKRLQRGKEKGLGD